MSTLSTIAVPDTLNKSERRAITRAMQILEARIKYVDHGDAITSPDATRKFLQLRCAALACEVFGIMYLDNRHRVITCAELFRGTIDGASVHPREVMRAVLDHNAAAVIFYHNHPSGNPEPSHADKRLTTRLRDALQLIDVRVLDHVVVGPTATASFAELGLL